MVPPKLSTSVRLPTHLTLRSAFEINHSPIAWLACKDLVEVAKKPVKAHTGSKRTAHSAPHLVGCRSGWNSRPDLGQRRFPLPLYRNRLALAWPRWHGHADGHQCLITEGAKLKLSTYRDCQADTRVEPDPAGLHDERWDSAGSFGARRVAYVPPYVPLMAGRDRSSAGSAAEAYAARPDLDHNERFR